MSRLFVVGLHIHGVSTDYIIVIPTTVREGPCFFELCSVKSWLDVLNTWDEVKEAKEAMAELRGKVWSSGAKHTRKVFADHGRNSSEQRSTLRIVHYKTHTSRKRPRTPANVSSRESELEA